MSSITASKGYEQPLIYAGTPPAETEVAATTTDQIATSGIIDVGTARRLTIWGQVDAGAAGSIVVLKVWQRAVRDKPATTGRWYPASKTDDLSANLVEERAPIAGSPVATLAPAWSQNTLRPLDVRTAAAINATDETPFKVTFDVGDARWAMVTFVQADGGAAANVLAYYSLSSG